MRLEREDVEQARHLNIGGETSILLVAHLYTNMQSFWQRVMPATKDTTSVRITRTAHEKLQRLAEARGESLTEALDRIIEAQRRQHLFDQADQRYAELRQDEEAWDEVKRERDELDGALADGLGGQDA